jgi:hypothetical protein
MSRLVRGRSISESVSEGLNESHSKAGPAGISNDDEYALAVVLAKVENGKVKRRDLCGAPSPHSARRTGEYPGLPDS